MPISSDTFTAKVDGVVYEETSLFVTILPFPSGDVIQIAANKSLTETIGLTLPSDISVGEYDFAGFTSQTEPTAMYTVNGDIYTPDGKITISQHDKISKVISGTFNFEAVTLIDPTPIFSITEGEFSVSY